MDVHSDRTFAFDTEPARFWAAVGAVDDYPRWWPWLREFEGEGLVEGDQWRCAVKPPLPYVVRFRIGLDEVVEERLVRATVSGDIEGTARLEVSPRRDDACVVRLESVLRPASTILRVMGTVGRPLMRYGHDWVLDVGAGQFASRAL